MTKNNEKSNQNAAKDWRDRSEPLLAVREDERWVGGASLKRTIRDKRPLKQNNRGTIEHRFMLAPLHYLLWLVYIYFTLCFTF